MQVKRIEPTQIASTFRASLWAAQPFALRANAVLSLP